MRSFISLCLALFAVVAWAEPKRPNIVICLADDLSLLDCSPYNAQCGIRTPNMERLAKNGMTFNYAFVSSPACAPSRGSLLTGLCPVRSGAMFNHQKPFANSKRWPAYFQELGYEVVAIGKVAHYNQVKEYGFDHCSHFNYHQDVCVDEAVKWLKERKSDKPLCFLVGTNWPHVPWPEEKAYSPGNVRLPPTLVDTPETREYRARYATAVTMADRDLGKVYDAAREKFGDDFLFLFSSDNGCQFPFGKWNLYDEGIRTPLFAVWKGHIKPADSTDAMVSWFDILPTCLEAAGATPPKSGDKANELTGRSFWPVLTGATTTHRDQIFTTHTADGKMNEYPIRSVRTRDWKYVRNLTPDAEHHTHIDKAAGGAGKTYSESWLEKAKTDTQAAVIVERYHRRAPEELYDLQADPYEMRNLIDDPTLKDRLTKLRADLDAWMAANGDRGLDTENAMRPK